MDANSGEFLEDSRSNRDEFFEVGFRGYEAEPVAGVEADQIFALK